MAEINSDAVASIDTNGVVRPNEYFGNVQYIPLAATVDGATTSDTLVFSKALPDNTKVIGACINNAAGQTVDIGVTGDTDAILDGAADAATTSACVPVDASNKQILGVVGATITTGTITGYVLVVTDQ